MAKVFIEDTEMQDIADAIREKNGTEETYKPSEMSGAIMAIDTTKPEQEKSISITENGVTEVLPDEGKVLSKVSVNVDVSGGGSEESVWVEDNSQIVFTRQCYQNGNISLFISENGTATYKRTIRKDSGNYYPNHFPKWSFSNLNQAIGGFGKDAPLYISVKQAEIKNVEDAIDEELIKIIGKSCFCQMSSLERLKIPDTIAVVEDYAFAYCYKLKRIVLPDIVTSLGSNVCRNDSCLEEFKIPPLVTELGSYSFSECQNIRTVTGIERMNAIGVNCFDGCCKLQGHIVLNEAITELGANVFRNCASLESIKFLGTPTTINSGCFQYCYNILDIYVPWSEGEVANAPWGATNATIHYNTVYDENHNPIIEEE